MREGWVCGVLAFGLMAGAAGAASTDYDVSMLIRQGSSTGSNTTVLGGFRMVATSDPFASVIGETSSPWFLEIGKRYRIENDSVGTAPLALESWQSSIVRTALCVQGAEVGTAEGLASVEWHEDGRFVYFTYSEELANLLTAGGRTAHATVVGSNNSSLIFRRGAVRTGFVWTGDNQPQIESFETGTTGDYIFGARGDWFVSSTAATLGYLATLSDTPAGALGQAPGSTKWLRVSDTTQPDNLLNSVVLQPVVAPVGTNQIQYTWEFRLNMVTTSFGTRAYIGPEHLNTTTGGYVRAWGIAATHAGLELVLNEDAIAADAVVGPGFATLYPYTQAGFAKGQWVRVVLNAQLRSAGPDALNALTATVYPSNGGAPVSQTIEWAGDAFRPEVSEGAFRFAIDNTTPANNSVLCLDNLSLQTSGATPTGVEGWDVYQ